MGNSECGIKRGGRESSSTKDFQGRTPNTICYRKLLRLFILWIIPKSCGAEGVEGGERKAPSSPPQRRNLCMTAQRYEETASEIKQSKNAA